MCRSVQGWHWKRQAQARLERASPPAPMLPFMARRRLTRSTTPRYPTYAVGCLGSRSTPFCDTAGSVQRLRLKQQGRRIPAMSLEQATSMRRRRVSGWFVARIQRIQSHRACGVICIQSACASGTASRALFTSAGTAGSGHSLAGSISSMSVSPASAPVASRRVSSNLNQWLPFPSGSTGA